MTRIRTHAPAAALAAALALALLAAPLPASPALAFTAAQTENEEESPGEAARDLALESISKLMRAMELLLDSIPQYEAPEITEEGDIIIRRKREEGEPPAEAPEVPDQKET
jgi:hypothetical protein